MIKFAHLGVRCVSKKSSLDTFKPVAIAYVARLQIYGALARAAVRL